MVRSNRKNSISTRFDGSKKSGGNKAKNIRKKTTNRQYDSFATPKVTNRFAKDLEKITDEINKNYTSMIKTCDTIIEEINIINNEIKKLRNLINE
tara:strand:- start:1518 stop:1802 length:285 start_codon:yes stop_codon:yes gene_type:complete